MANLHTRNPSMRSTVMNMWKKYWHWFMNHRLHLFFHFNQQSQLIFPNSSTDTQNVLKFNLNVFLASFPVKNNISIFPNFRRFTLVSDTWTFFPTVFYAHRNGYSERIFQHFSMLSGSFESYWGPLHP